MTRLPSHPTMPALCLMASLMFTACGGGGGDVPTAASASISSTPALGTATLSTVGAADTGSAVLASNGAAAATTTATAAATLTTGDNTALGTASSSASSTASSTAPASTATPAANASGSAALPADAQPAPTLAPPSAPRLPRSSLVAADLAVLVAEGDALSEAIGRAYQRARGIPDSQVIRVKLPTVGNTSSDAISDSDFSVLKAAIDAMLPATVQATLVTWSQPSRVQGASCAMSLTSALAFGYNAAQCGSCNRTQASAYYDTDTTRPWTDLRMRPSMMLGAASLDAAQALIQRGLAAEASLPGGSGWLLRTADAARSVRWPDFIGLPAAWIGTPTTRLFFLDASAAGTVQELVGQQDLMFYLTGTAKLTQLASNRFLPGAVADHLTSFGGYLPDGRGQMPATAWLTAGATASYGTVEEPCNYQEKFPRASVLIEHYQRGATVLEAYWKSVAWPGQGLFVGDPLARPWANTPSAVIEGGALMIRSRALRRGAVYRVEWLAAGSSQWQMLDSQVPGQPRDLSWRITLPAPSAGGRLRWIAPCALQPGQPCVLAGG